MTSLPAQRDKVVRLAQRVSQVGSTLTLATTLLTWRSEAAVREEPFDREPANWEGVNNRNAHFAPKTVAQDFGYSPSTRHAGGQPGEVGGRIYQAGEAAYYGYRLPQPLSLDAALSASGRMFVARGPGHFLLGFFNTSTLNEWRTPNTMAARINGRGEVFHGHVEYCSSRWRAEAGVIGEIIRGDRLELLTLQTPLYARGKVSMLRGVSDSTASIGFYHSTWSMQSNPSQQQSIPKDYLGINIEGPSSEGFFFYPVYRVHGEAAKALGGGSSKAPRIHPDRKVHDWFLKYDPEGANGRGRITVGLDGQTCALDLDAGHKEIGASFNRFGIGTPWIDGNSVTVFFDDLLYTCAPGSDPRTKP